MRVTISDVALRAGVSKSTVSNYINARYEKMSDSTKQAISNAMRELEYIPNVSAQRLANKTKSRTICLIIPRNMVHIFDSLYYPTVFRAIEKAAAKRHYRILLYPMSGIRDDDFKYLNGISSSLIDGYIVFDLYEDNLFFRDFESKNIPYICVGKIWNVDDYNFVASDHQKAIEDSIKYLRQLHHEKIGFVTLKEDSVVSKVRDKGILEICSEQRIPPENIIRYDHKYQVRNADDETLLHMWEEIFNDKTATAFIISSNVRPMMLLAAQKCGLHVPDDFSYINIEYYQRSPLDETVQTRVESRAKEVAEIAFEELRKKINSEEERKKRTNILIPLYLTIGDTTAFNPKA